MNPAGWLSDEEKEALKKEIGKMKAQEFREDTWVAIAQLLKNQNWLMTELQKTQGNLTEIISWIFGLRDAALKDRAQEEAKDADLH